MRYRHKTNPAPAAGAGFAFACRICKKTNISEKLLSKRTRAFLVEEGGFEPPKSMTADLQSAPFGRSGTLPNIQLRYLVGGAGGRTRTPDLLITNQLLYQLSYTSLLICFLSTDVLYYIISKTDCQEFFKNFLIFLLSASSAFAVP
jgi:hypothetical protein